MSLIMELRLANQTPLRGMGISVPNVMIVNCPPFSPQLYRKWRREVKLWADAQAGKTVPQITPKLITTVPLAVKMEALTYMEETEKGPRSRDIPVGVLACRVAVSGKLIPENRGYGYRNSLNSR